MRSIRGYPVMSYGYLCASLSVKIDFSPLLIKTYSHLYPNKQPEAAGQINGLPKGHCLPSIPIVAVLYPLKMEKPIEWYNPAIL